MTPQYAHTHNSVNYQTMLYRQASSTVACIQCFDSSHCLTIYVTRPIHTNLIHPRHRLTHLRHRITHPRHRITHPRHRLTHLRQRLTHPRHRPTHLRHRLTHSKHRLTHPKHRLTHPRHRTDTGSQYCPNYAYCPNMGQDKTST